MSHTNESFQKRAHIIATRTINLTETDPVQRLRELCRQGKYRYRMGWDRFQNGIMIDCEFWYFFGRKRRQVLAREVQFVSTTDVSEAQRIIAAIFLQNIGLGVETEDVECSESDPEFEGSECSEPQATPLAEDLVKLGMRAVNDLIARQNPPDNIDEKRRQIHEMQSITEMLGTISGLAKNTM